MRKKARQIQGLIDLVNSIKKDNLKILEVGSYRGESAEIFLQSGKVANITCVDPWEDVDLYGYGNDYSGMCEIEADFDENMKKYGSMIVKFKGTLNDFINAYLEKMPEFDFVYIDGIHTYDMCKNDIKNSLLKLNLSLGIAGHDYVEDGHVEHIRGVKKAVDEIFGTVGVLHFCDSSWFCPKPLVDRARTKYTTPSSS